MKKAGARALSYFAFSLSAFACTGVTEHMGTVAASPTETPSYLCGYFPNGYDDLNTCQTATHAACSGSSETLPNGASATCYFPPTGFEACQVAPTWDWIYTEYSDWCATTTPGVYMQSRSVIGCSSTLCACNNPIQTTQTCSGGACAGFTPNPLTEMPTPAPCP